MKEKTINSIHCECPNCHSKFDITPPTNTFIKVGGICSCGVPSYLHGTSCGWDNASVVIQNGETTIVSNLTGEEKKQRWLQSIKSPDAAVDWDAIRKEFNSEFGFIEKYEDEIFNWFKLKAANLNTEK